MFENLTGRLSAIVERLRGRASITEADVKDVMRDIRVALLEADVALPVVKDFVARAQEKAIGQEVLSSLSPGQLIIKIVHDHLVETLGGASEGVNLNAPDPVVIMMVGLQGSGKTTLTGKLGQHLSNKQRKKVLMASLDIYRPVAREQLEILGTQAHVATLPIITDEKPLAIARRALDTAKREGYDVLLLDTAGRLHIDDVLVDEVVQIKAAVLAHEIILVADAMMGQDAVNVAKVFQERIGLTGIAMSRIDGDARGGAALSMRMVTGVPIKLLSTGEKLDQLEFFHPDRLANRILGMGDVVSLVEKAMDTINQDDAEKMAKRMQQGLFTLDDFADQLSKMTKMGGLSSMLNLLPGMNGLQDKIKQSGVDDKMIQRQIAIIGSMTKKERHNHKILNGSRRQRIARGSGVAVQDVNKLLKQYQDMDNMLKRVRKLGQKGVMRQGIRGLFGR